MPADIGQEAADRLAALAACSAPGPGVTRLPFTPEHRRALDLLTGQMQAAGLAVHLDAAGTLIGRLEGPPGAPTLILGSHQDSVREGGAFDGAMGVVLPILAVEALRDRGIALPFAVEVMAFADEEGVRFPTALIGPRALAGTFDPGVLDMADADGVPLRTAMTGFGLDPDALPGLTRDPASVLGYLEVHIEQGPVLERSGAALGVVTAICGIERHGVVLTGETGHAGTLPMALRRDALVGAAALVTEVDRLARDTPGLLGTVGTLALAPGAVNAVPREVRMTVELRAPDDAVREAAGAALTAFARQMAASGGLGLDMQRSYAQAATPCDPALSDRLAAAVSATTGKAAPSLPSGATHDASAMADLCPVAMLFVRCRDGLSHHPDEFAAPPDMAAAVSALTTFLTAPDLARRL
ncbi:M20 family metallo-hydrolase [Maritimibacter fusiformis]|uniref:M20 family metallo-hydrolase n=1 Tax=Maritimibacter fusiformis TaxID=2603819 RepID=A0A5D0RQL5_9RHOB|nr:M20 family metallo-hydrolase [Maritimibacter fusiformis]TYB83185.1 M20 family metallo-hydrolase [Maritimibacter fusiformis]